MQIYIVLGVTLFMMVMFVWQKFPFGVTTMTCVVMLALTGVIDVETAFGGFGDEIIILVAPMMVLGAMLGKTSLVSRIRFSLHKMQGKQGSLLVMVLFFFTAVLVQFIPATAALAIMVVFVTQIPSDGEVTPSRVILPMLGVASVYKVRMPIGSGATLFALINAMYAGIITDTRYHLTMMEPIVFCLIPMIMVSAFCIFGWRLMPKNEGSVSATAVEGRIKESSMDPKKEKIVYAVFVAVMIVLITDFLGIRYLAPAIGVLVLLYSKVLNAREASQLMTSDMIWMMAGVLVVADALGISGTSELIGNWLLNVIGENPSSFSVMLLFSAVTIIMTNFLSNVGTQAVLVPIAASLALAGGWDPRGLVLIAGIANMADVALPSGSGEAAVAFAAGGYNPARVLKFTIPYMAVSILAYAISAQLLYPLYG